MHAEQSGRWDRLRASIAEGRWTPAQIRTALRAVAPPERDAWVDRLLGIEDVPDDAALLPRGCAPYLPCSADAILRAAEAANISDTDVFVDVGSGVGRAGLLVHFLTGASIICLEIQPALVAASRAHAQRLQVGHFSVVEGDAAELAGDMNGASVFFLYCPFGGARLQALLDRIEPIALARPLRICSVDLALPHRPWLSAAQEVDSDLRLYRTHALGRSA